MTNKNMNMKKDDKNSRSLKASILGSCLVRTLGIHGGYECVAQLSLSRAIVFFLLLAAAFSHVAVPCVLKMLKLA